MANLAGIRSFLFGLIQVSICFLRLMEVSVILTAHCRMEDYTTPPLVFSDTLRTFTFKPPKVMPEVEREKPDCIAGGVVSSLEEECAREILSLFMLSICMSVECVKGKTHSDSDGYMTNTTFTELAEKISQAGLAGSTKNALLYVIPAFAKFGLLPRIKSDVRQPRSDSETILIF